MIHVKDAGDGAHVVTKVRLEVMSGDRPLADLGLLPLRFEPYGLLRFCATAFPRRPDVGPWTKFVSVAEHPHRTAASRRAQSEARGCPRASNATLETLK